MSKKILIFTIFSLFYLFIKQTTISAREYCHLYINNSLVDSLQIPFYLHKNTKYSKIELSQIKIEYTTTPNYIDSITKCELISETINYDYTSLTKLIVFDYSYTPYTSNSLSSIFENSILKQNNSTLTAYASIKDNEPPFFSNYNDYYETNINNPISLSMILNTISAYDKREGNLTDKIEIVYSEYEDNTENLGTYPIILSVQDSSNNKATITITIKIIDKEAPIITGKTNFISYLSSPLNIEQIKNELIVTDNVDTNLNSELYICDDTYSSNKKTLGIYQLYFCVYDHSSNHSTPYKTIIEVKDDIPPTIEGLDYYISSLSNPLSIQEIIYSLAAIDNNNDISQNIFIQKDYYSSYQNTLGEKSIFFQAMDESLNISNPFKVVVNLIDDIPPQIFGLNTYNSYLSNSLSISYLKQQLYALDNFDGDITQHLELVEDSYSNNINKKGTFYLTFIVKDSSNNSSSPFKIQINSIDDIPPKINGNNTLTYSITNKPSINEIVKLFSISDNIDNNLEIEIIKDTFSSSLITGTYYLELTSTDLSNNKSIPTIVTINVIEKIINTNSITLFLSTTTLLTIEEINSLINLNEQYTITNNTYEKNYNIKGNYIIEYKLNDSSLKLNITTYNPPDIQLVANKKKETLLTKIKSFFTKIINIIKKFFSKLNIFLIYSKLLSYQEIQH